ncbi:MFS transporter [Nocardiopsis sp. NPDC006832]|uniref:MFS transporter n=1 Tax=Nocardiopsis sp. NPDC006832 TaxID=3157188 RepID=UPI0033F801A8
MSKNFPTPERDTVQPPKLTSAFHRFWAGAMASNLADGVMLTVIPMIAAAMTNDPLAVAGLTAARYAPWLLFGLFAGVLVDRVNRVRAMVMANLMRSGAVVALAVFVAMGGSEIAVLYAVMFFVMSCEIVYDISGRSVLPVIARGSLDRANGRLVGGREVVQEFIGSPLGGFLFVVAAALPLAVNAGAYVLGALILLGLPLAAQRPAVAPKADSPGTVRSVFTQIGEGLQTIWTDPPLRVLVVFGAVINLGAGAVAAVFVLIVQNHFGVPEALFGVFLAVAAVGAIGGAALASRAAAKVGRFWTITGGFFAQAVFCALFAFAPNPIVAAVAWALVAGASTLGGVLSAGILQLTVPEHLMGRVMSAKMMLSMGLLPVGALLGGMLGRLDLRFPALFGTVIFTVATLLALRSLRAMSARADSAERAAREAAVGEEV